MSGSTICSASSFTMCVVAGRLCPTMQGSESEAQVSINSSSSRGFVPRGFIAIAKSDQTFVSGGSLAAQVVLVGDPKLVPTALPKIDVAPQIFFGCHKAKCGRHRGYPAHKT